MQFKEINNKIIKVDSIFTSGINSITIAKPVCNNNSINNIDNTRNKIHSNNNVSSSIYNPRMLLNEFNKISDSNVDDNRDSTRKMLTFSDIAKSVRHN